MLADDDHLWHLKRRGLSRADDDHLRHRERRRLGCADDDHLRHAKRRRLGCADDDHLRHLKCRGLSRADDDHLRHRDGRWDRHSRQRGGKTSPHQRKPKSAEDRDQKRLGHETTSATQGRRWSSTGTHLWCPCRTIDPAHPNCTQKKCRWERTCRRTSRD